MICAYLGCNITAIQTQLTGIASLNEEISGNSTAVIDFIHCSNKEILCSGIDDADHISEEVLSSLEGKFCCLVYTSLLCACFEKEGNCSDLHTLSHIPW
jgi:hypothetical protein